MIAQPCNVPQLSPPVRGQFANFLPARPDRAQLVSRPSWHVEYLYLVEAAQPVRFISLPIMRPYAVFYPFMERRS